MPFLFLPPPHLPRSGMKQRCNKYLLNGDIVPAPLSFFSDDPIPSSLLCGRIQTSYRAAAQCIPFWLEFKEQLQTNKYYYHWHQSTSLSSNALTRKQEWSQLDTVLFKPKCLFWCLGRVWSSEGPPPQPQHWPFVTVCIVWDFRSLEADRPESESWLSLFLSVNLDKGLNLFEFLTGHIKSVILSRGVVARIKWNSTLKVSKDFPGN